MMFIMLIDMPYIEREVDWVGYLADIHLVGALERNRRVMECRDEVVLFHGSVKSVQDQVRVYLLDHPTHRVLSQSITSPPQGGVMMSVHVQVHPHE